MTKQDYVNEILRFCRILTQQKYDSDEDKRFKLLIAENLKQISEIERIKRANREEAKASKAKDRFYQCVKR